MDQRMWDIRHRRGVCPPLPLVSGNLIFSPYPSKTLSVIETIFNLDVIVAITIISIEEIVIPLGHVPFGLRQWNRRFRCRGTRGNCCCKTFHKQLPQGLFKLLKYNKILHILLVSLPICSFSGHDYQNELLTELLCWRSYWGGQYLLWLPCNICDLGQTFSDIIRSSWHRFVWIHLNFESSLMIKPSSVQRNMAWNILIRRSVYQTLLWIG